MVGLLLDYCIGPYIPYVWLSIVASSVPLIFTMIFMWMPESPYYYLSVHKKEEAEKALQWLKGTRVGLSSELADIQVIKTSFSKGFSFLIPVLL